MLLGKNCCLVFNTSILHQIETETRLQRECEVILWLRRLHFYLFAM